MRHFARLSAALVALAFVPLAFVAACSESPAGPVEAATTATPAASSAPSGLAAALDSGWISRSVTATPTTAMVTTCSGSTIVLSADEKRTLDLHNAQRAASSLSLFCVDSILTYAARAHTAEMFAKTYFSHNSYNGESVVVRLKNFGYTPFHWLGENMAWGSNSLGTPEHVFTNWMNSAPHRTNIMNGALKQIGIGVQSGTFLGYSGARVYTVDFGTH